MEEWGLRVTVAEQAGVDCALACMFSFKGGGVVDTGEGGVSVGGNGCFASGLLMICGGIGGLKSSRMLLGLAGGMTGRYLRRNLRFQRVTRPDPSTLMAYWSN